MSNISTSNTVLGAYNALPNSKISELEMLILSPVNQNKCILLVEGPDDKIFYGFFVNNSHVLFNIMSGCYNMSEILNLANQSQVLKNKIIAIKDADFDHLNGITYNIPNLFLTDTHDWETLVMTKDCEKKILMECKVDELIEEIFHKVMIDLLNYSFLKFYNINKVCAANMEGILFKGLKISKFYDGDSQTEIDPCLQAVRKHGNNYKLPHFPKQEEINTFKNEWKQINLEQISCGHDILHGIVCRLSYLLNKNSCIGYSDLERICRCAYTLDDFKKTHLYKSVLLWSQNNGKEIWRE